MLPLGGYSNQKQTSIGMQSYFLSVLVGTQFQYCIPFGILPPPHCPDREIQQEMVRLVAVFDDI